MIGLDGSEGAARRDRYRAAHVAHVEALDRVGQIVLAGPIRNEGDDASVGAIIVFEARDLAEAREIVDRDPYVIGGVFESLLVAPFRRAFPKVA